MDLTCSTYQSPGSHRRQSPTTASRPSRSASAPASASIGAGIGVGFIFGKVIESVTRQPEMREEITSIQWLGFALTEAVAFYTFIFGLIAFFL